MSINPAINTGVSSAQVGYAQNITSAQDTQASLIESRIPVQEEVDSSALRQQNEPSAQQAGARGQQRVGEFTAQKGVQQTTGTQTAQQSAQAGEAAQGQPQAEAGDVASRTLRLALADNSRQLQNQFNKAGDAQQAGQPQQSGVGAEARRTVMLRNLESMVNMQLAQYTGNEPYSRANYRQILGALGQMQGGGTTSKSQDPSKAGTAADDNAFVSEEAEQKDGVYKLYSGQAAKTLSAITSSHSKHDSQDALDFVA